MIWHRKKKLLLSFRVVAGLCSLFFVSGITQLEAYAGENVQSKAVLLPRFMLFRSFPKVFSRYALQHDRPIGAEFAVCCTNHLQLSGIL